MIVFCAIAQVAQHHSSWMTKKWEATADMVRAVTDLGTSARVSACSLYSASCTEVVCAGDSAAADAATAVASAGPGPFQGTTML